MLQIVRIHTVYNPQSRRFHLLFFSLLQCFRCRIKPFPGGYLECILNGLVTIVAHQRVASGSALPPGFSFFKILDRDSAIAKRDIFPDEFWIFCTMMVMTGPAGSAFFSVYMPVVQIKVAIPEGRFGHRPCFIKCLAIMTGQTYIFILGIACIKGFRIGASQQSVVRSGVWEMTNHALPDSKGKMLGEFLVIKGLFRRGQDSPPGVFQISVMATET